MERRPEAGQAVGPDHDVTVSTVSKARGRLVLSLLVGLLVATGAWLAVGDVPSDQVPEDRPPVDLAAARQPDARVGSGDRADAASIAEAIPLALLAAERFAADPGADGLGDLLASLGGIDGLTIAETSGAFEMVRFDPLDTDRLIATNRLSYGSAENQGVNELWSIGPSGLVRSLWAPETSHDFVHFNTDGTVTMWVHGGGQGYAPRIAAILSNDFAQLVTTAPVYASRFASIGGKVFALTGNGDYYTNDPAYVDLIVDDGASTRVLGSGAPYGWIDTPHPDLLVAYPVDSDGSTMVWDVDTLEPQPDHPLAGRRHRRSAISRNGAVAVAADFDGRLEVIDLASGAVVDRFGRVDVVGVDRPITVDPDGRTVITVEGSGRVTIWWLGDGAPVATMDADAAQPRWLSEEYAPASASAVAADASRVALRSAAQPGVDVAWRVVDTDIDSWMARACELAGRALSSSERQAVDLAAGPPAC